MNTTLAFFRSAFFITLFGLVLISCDDDAPAVENEEEVISDVILTFTPQGGGELVEFSAIDPDGQGPQQTVKASAPLKAGTTYLLSVALLGPNGEDIAAEVAQEADEHMIYFGWDGNLFSTPAGNGNIDAREEGTVIYDDEDGNGLPLGLSTRWTTAAAPATGSFRIIMKHQPNLKTSTATVNAGATDVDVSWENISVVE